MMLKFALQGISQENFPKEFRYALLPQRLQKRRRIQNIVSEQIFCLISGFESSLLKYKKFYKLKARKFDFQKYKTSFQKGFFLFFRLGKFRFRKYKGFFSGYIRCMKYKKNFLLRKYNKFLHDRARKFHLQYKNFLYFSSSESYFVKFKKFFRVSVY